MGTGVRAVAPDRNLYLSMYAIFKTGDIAKVKNLREGGRYLPDNIYKAIDDFKASSWNRRNPRLRCAGPRCRPERSRSQPLPARTGHHRQRLRSPVPPWPSTTSRSGICSRPIALRNAKGGAPDRLPPLSHLLIFSSSIIRPTIVGGPLSCARVIRPSFGIQTSSPEELALNSPSLCFSASRATVM